MQPEDLHRVKLLVDIQKFEVNCSDPPRDHCPFLAPPVTNIDDITARQLETKHVTKDMLLSASCHQGHSWFSINRSAGPGPSHSSGSCTLKHIATSHKQMLVYFALGNAKFWRRVHCPTPTPDARYFAFWWNIGFRLLSVLLLVVAFCPGFLPQ